MRLLRTNSVKETFELRKLEFLTRLLERGNPRELAANILAEVNSHHETRLYKTKTSRKCFAFCRDLLPSLTTKLLMFKKHYKPT